MAHSNDNWAELAAHAGEVKGRRVVVLGDLVLDEFIYGEVKRVYGDVARTSREVAFGLMLRQQSVDRRPGGAANAVNNLLALGAKPVPFGFVGNDEAGRWLRAYFRKRGVSTNGIRAVRGWTTPVKTRIVAGTIQSSAQQVLRLDREELTPPGTAARRQLLRGLKRALRGADALLVADYGYGAATPDQVNGLLKRNKNLPVILDSRYRVREFRRASILTPSLPELEEAYQRQIGQDQTSLVRVLRGLMKETAAQAILLTRGRHGMLLLERGRPPLEIPAFGDDQVADVTGAGDTVAAALTAALAAGADVPAAARLANVAGGLVVQKRGTATVSAAELKRAVKIGNATRPGKARR